MTVVYSVGDILATKKMCQCEKCFLTKKQVKDFLIGVYQNMDTIDIGIAFELKKEAVKVALERFHLSILCNEELEELISNTLNSLFYASSFRIQENRKRKFLEDLDTEKKEAEKLYKEAEIKLKEAQDTINRVSKDKVKVSSARCLVFHDSCLHKTGGEVNRLSDDDDLPKDDDHSKEPVLKKTRVEERT